EPVIVSSMAFIKHSVTTLPYWLAFSALVLAYVLYVWLPAIPRLFANAKSGFGIIYHLLVKKYFIEALYDVIFVNIFLALSIFLW
ncbi:NADH-quinone oxidoreductase subunit L, partial [Francisella tularensis subsp. holarctica]|nr:NADH-quinone oxidoreductase subunit L [Francisella tularensis subsp. holarctica]